MLASKFPWETSCLALTTLLPLNKRSQKFRMCVLQQTAMLVVTWHSGTSCCMYSTAHLLWERWCPAYFSPPAVEGGGGRGGCRLIATAEWNDCRLFFTAFGRYFQTVQTGRYAYNNRRACSSCPLHVFVYPGSHTHTPTLTWSAAWSVGDVTSHQRSPFFRLSLNLKENTFLNLFHIYIWHGITGICHYCFIVC